MPNSNHSYSNNLVYLYAQILVLSVLCFLLLLAHEKMPDKVDVLFPKGTENVWLFSDGDAKKGGSSAKWQDKLQNKYSCNITHAIDWPYCGLEAQLTPDFAGLDISEYKLFKVYVEYEGPSTQIGVSLRTLEPSSFIENDISSLKSSIVPIDTYELKGGEVAIEILPKEFQVHHWWLDRYNIKRKNRYTDFSHVVVVGLNLSDNPKDGMHHIQLKRIEMVKNSISETTWYIFVISLWLFLVFLLVSWHLIRLLKQSKLHSSKVDALSIYAGELAQLSQMHKEESMRDDLTCLNNRKGMGEYLNHLLRNNETVDLSLIIFDLDFFKKVNDTYGHDVGDQVLIKVSSVISQNIRKSDCFCRWGGEEFAVICPSMPVIKAKEFANKLCKIIAEIEIIENSVQIDITASFGVSSGTIDKNNLLDLVFEKADNALYKAKDNGRNRVECM